MTNFINGGYTNSNAFSQLEDVYSIFTGLQAAQRLYPAGEVGTDPFIRQLCTLEAHDCQRVQGQRTGEFYYQENNEVSPSGRKTLCDKLKEIKGALNECLQKSAGEFLPEKTAFLANICNSKLQFGRVNLAERYSGKVKNFGGIAYASGNFIPRSSCVPLEAKSTPPVSDAAGVKSGAWQITLDGDRIIMDRQGKRSVFSVVDSCFGTLTPVKSVFTAENGWITAEIMLICDGRSGSMVTLRGITVEDAEYIDWQISSVPGDFPSQNRWENYLALSFEYPDDAEVKAFTPNLCHTVKKQRIYSVYFLQMADFSLLFDAVKFFRRRENRIDFLFHAADETVHQRRITVDFSGEFPLHRSRALSTGLYPAEKIPYLPPFESAEVSVEAAVAPGSWLISNLTGSSIVPELPENCRLTDLKGEKISHLMPAQCALLAGENAEK